MWDLWMGKIILVSMRRKTRVLSRYVSELSGFIWNLAVYSDYSTTFSETSVLLDSSFCASADLLSLVLSIARSFSPSCSNLRIWHVLSNLRFSTHSVIHLLEITHLLGINEKKQDWGKTLPHNFTSWLLYVGTTDRAVRGIPIVSMAVSHSLQSFTLFRQLMIHYIAYPLTFSCRYVP